MAFTFSSSNRLEWLAKRLPVAALVAVASTAPVYAQLDPLLFLKSSAQPTVLLLVDTANRMQRDAPTDPANPQTTSNYYDTFAYPLDVTKIALDLEVRIGVLRDQQAGVREVDLRVVAGEQRAECLERRCHHAAPRREKCRGRKPNSARQAA